MKKNIIAITLMVSVMASVCACSNSKVTETTATQTTVSETTMVETTTAETITAETTTAETTTVETTTSETAATETTANENTYVEGILTDASMNYFEIQDKDGKTLMFSKPEDGNIDNTLENGLILGNAVKVTYTGDPENGSAVAIGLADSDMEAMTLDSDAYQTIIEINQSIKLQDMEGLAYYMAFPCYVHIESYDDAVSDKDAFMKLPGDELFNADFMLLADYNIFDIQEADAGIVVGDGAVNYILSKNESDSYVITGINAVK